MSSVAQIVMAALILAGKHTKIPIVIGRDRGFRSGNTTGKIRMTFVNTGINHRHQNTLSGSCFQSLTGMKDGKMPLIQTAVF